MTTTSTNHDDSPHTGRAAEENIQAVARLMKRAERRRTAWHRLSDGIVKFASRESTVVWHLIWFTLWLLINTGRIGIAPFDPFPFTLLTTLVSLEAIFLTLFVLESQNRMTQEADRRAHLDLQVNLLSEQEMTMVLRMLREVCEHLGLRETINLPKFIELTKRTDVGQLAEQLERSLPQASEGS